MGRVNKVILQEWRSLLVARILFSDAFGFEEGWRLLRVGLGVSDVQSEARDKAIV